MILEFSIEVIFKVNVFVFLFHDALNISFLGCLLLKSLFDCAIDFFNLCCFTHILMLVKMLIFMPFPWVFLEIETYSHPVI